MVSLKCGTRVLQNSLRGPVMISLWVLFRDLPGFYKGIRGLGFGGLVFRVLGAWPLGILGFEFWGFGAWGIKW